MLDLRSLLGSLEARRAAEALRPSLLRCGKMFGVLLARQPDGTVVVLKAFSGMLEGRWLVDGFVGPVFDMPARAAIEPAGEAQLAALTANCEGYAGVRAQLAALDAEHDMERMIMRERHRLQRQARRAQRAVSPSLAWDQESRADKAERRRFEVRCAELRAPLAVEAHRLLAVSRERAALSASLMLRIFDTYRLYDWRGESTLLRKLWEPHSPPAGAGDCVAPKLLHHALTHGLEPLGLAEFFWGQGARQHGAFYPPCDKKCAPILAFMLGQSSLAPRIVYEDDALLVVDKPAGLLSVPGRGALPSVVNWLPPGALLAHRLDQDTSGLLVAGRTLPAYKALQRQFADRVVEKRYVAILDGEPSATSGTVDLPLRVDLAHRPRQVHDPVHGKSARTDWRVLSRTPARVELTPHTGRTHQLRVHMAVGLGTPIRGDRLYGQAAERLHLHATHLALVHPVSSQRMCFDSIPPF